MSQINVNLMADSQGGSVAPISSVMRNRIINGAMVIDQRNAGASINPASGIPTFCVDRFTCYQDVTSRLTFQQNAGSVTPPAGFTNYLGATSSTAHTVTSNQIFGIYQSIEGFNIADLGWGTANAKTVTLSFRVYSSLTGTFGGALKNSGGTRSYPFNYTINAANTFEYKTIEIEGDTTGTWLTNNGIGITASWGLGVGSTYSGTAGAWAGSNFFSATGATSVVGTNGATFFITGVQLEKGTQATGFEYRQIGTELALCQRYFQVLGSGNAKPLAAIGYFSSTGLQGVVNTKVTMRAAPTFSIVTGTNFYIAYTASNNDTLNSITLDFASTDAVQFFNNTEASGTANAGGQLATNNASAFIAVQAEL